MVRFGPYAIDTRTWTLSRQGAGVDLSPRLVEILAYLVERDGAIATKDELLDRFWPDVHVTENTLTRAIADIRKALDDAPDRPQVIQTLARRGYRFVGTVTREPEPGFLTTPAAGDVHDDPFRQWVNGRLALESLDPARLDAARQAMQAAAAAMPGYAPAHAGTANAHVIAFEITRSVNHPNQSLLREALTSAQRAVALDARLGEGWAVLGHAQALAGRLDEAQAALRRALALEPDNWRHHVRLALASWGEARLRAADRALALWPSCAVAHLLSGMVFVARGAWDRAEAAADAGARLQDLQLPRSVLPVAGLHWLRGLALTGQGRLEDAAAAMAMEIAHAGYGIYATESRWLAQSSLGFLHLHAARIDAARTAFAASEALNQGAARGVLGLHLAGAEEAARLECALDELREGAKTADAVLIQAAALAWKGEAAEALGLLRALLQQAPPGPAGWSLVADPMFLPLYGDPAVREIAAAVAARAA